MATPNETINVTFDQPITFPLRGPYDYILMVADDDTIHRIELVKQGSTYYLRPVQAAEE